MRKNFIKIMAFLFITGCTTEKIELPEPPPPPPPTPQWTFMIYMTAENNLEPFAVSDLTEMAKVGSTPDVNLVVQVDRSPNYSSEAVVNLPDFTTTKRVLVQKENLQEISDLGELNMGDPNTLKDFITWAVTTYPAQKYALVIWDHGSSWQSAGQDETNNNDYLTLSEISNALDSINQHFNLIGFDECLMGSIEVAYEMSFHGNVLVASEETEPGVGWNYDIILSGVTQYPGMNEYELSKLIVDAYKDGVNEDVPEELFKTTLAAIDLTRIDMVLDSLNNFFYYLSNNVSSISDLIPVEIAVSQSEAYGKSDPFEGGQFFDLYNIAQYLSLNSSEPLSFLADNVKSSIDSITYYRWSPPERPHSHGLSIWWPTEEEDYNDNINDYRNIKFVADTIWEDFLTAYKGLKAQDTTLPTVANVAPSSNIVTPGTPITVTADVSDDSLVKTAYLISFIDIGGTLYAMDISREAEIYEDCINGFCPVTVNFEFDALGTTVGDGTSEDFFPTFRETDDVVSVTGIYQEDNEQGEALVFFNAISGNMIAMYLIGDEFSEYTPQPGSLFYPYDYIYVNGNIVPQQSSTGLIATSLRIQTEQPYPAGNYILAVAASDFSDNENYAGVNISVQ